MKRPSRVFLFRLCRELGFPHPDFLLDALTAEQVMEWEAYNEIDPIGQWRSEYSFAMIASVIVNIAKSVYSKNAKMTTALDFMPDWGKTKKEPKKQSVEEMKEILFAIAGVKK